MENSADALKIAFAILIFALAITTTFMLIGQAKYTADAVFYATDNINYYTYEGGTSTEVSIDTVISTLYRYYKESFRVIIKYSTDESRTDDDTIIGLFDLEKEKKIGAPWAGSEKDICTRLQYFITGEDLTLKEINNQSIKFKTSIITSDDIKSDNTGRDANKWIISNSSLNKLLELNCKIYQSFDEVTYSGKYKTAEDGSQITITPGGKKIYITYTFEKI